jgi:hypothetical protein
MSRYIHKPEGTVRLYDLPDWQSYEDCPCWIDFGDDNFVRALILNFTEAEQFNASRVWALFPNGSKSHLSAKRIFVKPTPACNP